MKKMNSDQIRTRLAEIKTEQAAHDARDFDTELLALMQSGGNVDALEGQQQDAERAARRLRVESQALQAMLPDVVRTEVRTEIEGLVRDGKPDQKALQECVDELIALNQKRLEIYEAIDIISERQKAAMNKARALTGLGRVSPHGEASGDAPIISKDLANELIGLMADCAIDLEQIPISTRWPLVQYLQARAHERDRSRFIADQQEIARQQAAAL
ncbi:hypothetical protein CBF45_16870 [Bordetella sp. J329]|nr:hypothetical protein CBF45_16870 [Bordetella sp. J329]